MTDAEWAVMQFRLELREILLETTHDDVALRRRIEEALDASMRKEHDHG